MPRLALVCSLSLALGVAPAVGAADVVTLGFTGYRILVEPEIVEAPTGELTTRALHWKLRSVWAAPDGQEYLVRLTPTAGAPAAAVADAQVIVDRALELTDHARQSADFRSLEPALRQFAALRRSADITRVGPPARRVVRVPPPPKAPRPLPAPAPVRTCQQALLDGGHQPNMLSKCDGVGNRCAVALLDGGHHPMHLSSCAGADARCAVALLGAGHHPMHLKSCVGVDGACAIALLDAGHHPMHLDSCRR